MKEFIRIRFFRGFTGSGGVGDKLPEEVFDECVQRWPEFKIRGNAAFNGYVEATSEKAREIISFIRARAGKEPKWTRFPAVFDDESVYQLFGERCFDYEEIAESEYCWCIPQRDIAKSGYRQDDGTLSVDRNSIMNQPIGSTISGFPVLCTHTFRSEIEKENFANLEFKSVAVTGKKPPIEPLWELSGKELLPPVLNKLVNDQGESPDESARGCWVDDLFFPPILTYRKASLEAAVGLFDVASTFERWNAGPALRRPRFLICSKAFRSWCQERKLKINRVPVRIEQDF